VRKRSRRYLTDVPDLEWCGQYILGGEDGHTPVPCYSLHEWGKWIEETDHRVVAQTGNDDWRVSTVFLGLDHRHWGNGPPILFETMVFRHGKSADEMERYSSWDDAETGHKAMVRKVFGKAVVAK
jgi:hypothetical protein